MDLGNVITVRLYIPSGYTYHAFHSFSVSDWTVVLKNIHVLSNYIDVQCVKMQSGAANVTMSACISCIKI